MRIFSKTFSKRRNSIGSALILAVVLSALLAMVGVLFVLVARMNKMATSAVSENMELNLAVDTVVARISQEMVLDVPGIIEVQATEPNILDPNATDPNAPSPAPVRIEEYYDYPDANNLWLASLEPYKSGDNYYWRQISDITGKLAGTRRNLRADIIGEYEPISDANAVVNADADGDGVGDSRWFKIDEITTGKGKSIYAAVRIVDNSAMINVNTGYKFDKTDPNVTISDVDGTSQLQINLMALAAQPGTSPSRTDDTNLLMERANYGVKVDPLDLGSYLQKVIWNYTVDINEYTPFGLSDELELRYRYILNHTDIDTRLEQWSDRFRSGSISTPVTSGGNDLNAWFLKAAGNGIFDPNYSYRHIATVQNMDRIINPAGTELNNGKMINVNAADKNLLFAALRAGLRDNGDPNSMSADELAAQLAVNIVDHRDLDAAVTTLTVGPKTFYGFEAQPFINEIAFRISSDNASVSTNNYFAIELYNPFRVDIPLSGFRLEICDVNDTVVKTIKLTGYVISAESRFVIVNSAEAASQFDISTLISTGGGMEDPNHFVLAEYSLVSADPPAYELSERYNIYLRRIMPVEQLYLDRQQTQDDWFTWSDVQGTSRFYCRDDSRGNYIYQNLQPASNTLGAINGTTGLRRNYNITNSAGPFISPGDIAGILTIAPSTDVNDMLGLKLANEPLEGLVRVDLLNPVYADIFQYLTVLDPTDYILPVTETSIKETRIKGRINVNTAPAFVIAQLPWMEPAVAQAIATYRDTISGAFESIAELMYVPQMSYYATNALDLDLWPDFTPADGAVDDFEERDIIFSRISNLITVRSDIFTAYILVRIGVDGPQRRVIAVLDRSGVNSPSDKVRILAVHPVPDPR
jgi:DNA uptake protein ComE-like DNA-binding protein